MPIALIVSAVYGIVRYRNDYSTQILQKIFSCVFVCYLSGLLCFVVGLDIIGIAWYEILYPMDSGRTVMWFAGEFDFVPDFFNNISGEVIGNFLIFMPFGVLYPLSKLKSTWKRTLFVGFLSVLAIELCQPIFGRAFDINDIILNTVGITIAASVFFAVKHLLKKNTART